jgi:hypothetical protein
VFYGALRYAVELRLPDANPIDHVQWTAPKSTEEIDRRVVVNPGQALQLLEAVARIELRLVALFACIYLRPRCGRGKRYPFAWTSASYLGRAGAGFT